ncbi:MAG: DUF1573 domain-containing protein [Bacteroidales bacterium]|nr:DUF1573 domain-containing protein [Bacteroidales bacterium]
MRYIELILVAAMTAACGNRNAREVQPQPVEAEPATPAVEEDIEHALDLIGETVRQPVMATRPQATSQGVDIEGIVSFDKTVHDFGDISIADGPQTCTFTVKNIGAEAIAIYEVAVTCGCTDVRWTREPVQPGKTGTISVTYKNEDGPLPFDKTLTAYIAGLSRPVTLRLRGMVHDKKRPLSELYGAHRLGALGLKSLEYKAGNLPQGESAGDEATVANLGKDPLLVTFTEVSPQLTLSVEPNPIPANSTAKLRFSIKADPQQWGLNRYFATPVLDGTPAGERIAVRAHTRENFAAWSEEQRRDGAQPIFDESTVTFGTIGAGTPVSASFTYTNKGKAPFHIYAAGTEDAPVRFTLPEQDTQGGQKGRVSLSLDTSSLPKGEAVIMLTLTTNSPSRPVVNLFLVGVVE